MASTKIPSILYNVNQTPLSAAEQKLARDNSYTLGSIYKDMGFTAGSWNSLTETGFYRIENSPPETDSPADPTSPESHRLYALVATQGNVGETSQNTMQLALGGKIQYRTYTGYNGTGWSDWKEVGSEQSATSEKLEKVVNWTDPNDPDHVEHTYTMKAEMPDPTTSEPMAMLEMIDAVGGNYQKNAALNMYGVSFYRNGVSQYTIMQATQTEIKDSTGSYDKSLLISSSLADANYLVGNTKPGIIMLSQTSATVQTYGLYAADETVLMSGGTSYATSANRMVLASNLMTFHRLNGNVTGVLPMIELNDAVSGGGVTTIKAADGNAAAGTQVDMLVMKTVGNSEDNQMKVVSNGGLATAILRHVKTGNKEYENRLTPETISITGPNYLYRLQMHQMDINKDMMMASAQYGTTRAEQMALLSSGMLYYAHTTNFVDGKPDFADHGAGDQHHPEGLKINTDSNTGYSVNMQLWSSASGYCADTLTLSARSGYSHVAGSARIELNAAQGLSRFIDGNNASVEIAPTTGITMVDANGNSLLITAAGGYSRWCGYELVLNALPTSPMTIALF